MMMIMTMIGIIHPGRPRGRYSGGEGKSRRAGKYGTKKSKERREGGSSRRSLLFFVPYFSVRLDFPSPPLSAPGSPRMGIIMIINNYNGSNDDNDKKHFSSKDA